MQTQFLYTHNRRWNINAKQLRLIEVFITCTNWFLAIPKCVEWKRCLPSVCTIVWWLILMDRLRKQPFSYTYRIADMSRSVIFIYSAKKKIIIRMEMEKNHEEKIPKIFRSVFRIPIPFFNNKILGNVFR